MVNIDAKVKDSNGEICRVEGVYDDEILVNYGGRHTEDSDFLKHGTYTVIEDIRGELEQQKQQINNLKTEILVINNDAVNSGDEVQMEITGRVIEVLENTIVDDWRVEE